MLIKKIKQFKALDKQHKLKLAIAVALGMGMFLENMIPAVKILIGIVNVAWIYLDDLAAFEDKLELKRLKAKYG